MNGRSPQGQKAKTHIRGANQSMNVLNKANTLLAMNQRAQEQSGIQLSTIVRSRPVSAGNHKRTISQPVNQRSGSPGQSQRMLISGQSQRDLNQEEKKKKKEDEKPPPQYTNARNNAHKPEDIDLDFITKPFEKDDGQNFTWKPAQKTNFSHSSSNNHVYEGITPSGGGGSSPCCDCDDCCEGCDKCCKCLCCCCIHCTLI